MIENSLDAGATRISVHVTVPSNSSSTETSAGLFSIQVTDNGSGIAKEDFELLCERHATSKLSCVGDLRSVGTFGFRGEALASCSQVARVEVTTRCRSDEGEVAWKASYTAGKLTGEPVAVAGNYGTIINVKDLFYANRVRREALLNSTEEYQKIVQVIQAYALNQSGRCAFILSKRRDRVEMQTSLTDSVVQVVKNLWNEEIGAAMLPFTIDSEPKLGIEEGSGGWATRTTFHKLKSPQVIIFLNGRLIEHSVLRRAILQAFSMHLPTSPPAHPFVYLKLELKGCRVDVNVHPSKRQVFFLDEEDIVKRVVGAIDTGILQRQYETQNLKPIVIERNRVGEERDTEEIKKAKVQYNQISCQSRSPVTSSSSTPKISALYPSQRVLTDHRNHRIDTFLFHSQSAQKSPLKNVNSSGDIGSNSVNNISATYNANTSNNNTPSSPFKWTQLDRKENKKDTSNKAEAEDTKMEEPVTSSSSQLDITSMSPALIDDASIVANTSIDITVNTTCDNVLESSQIHQSQSQMSSLLSKSNAQLCSLLKNSLLVGLIDSKWCLLQSGTNLLLCDMDRLNYDLFFSILAGEKAKGCFNVEIGVMGLFDSEVIGMEAVEVLKKNCNFLSDRFGIVFESACSDLILKSIPSVLPGQRCPSTRFLSTFLQRLCLLDYEAADKELNVLREMALLYALIDTEEWTDWEDYVKFVVINGYRDSRAKFTMKNEYEDGGDISIKAPVQIITNTETLYKSFERC